MRRKVNPFYEDHFPNKIALQIIGRVKVKI